MTHRLVFALLLASAAPSQTINTIAGNGTQSFSGDNGPATSASFNIPVSVATDLDGNVYIGDQYNQRIRRVDLNGIVTTIAGNGTAGFSGDNGPAVDAEFFNPTGVFLDGNGNIIVADVGNQRIRRIDTNGIVTTIAGDGGTGGYGGDGGPATSATFYNCVRAITDPAGNLYIADQSNHRVREVIASTGTINTIAGTGSEGFSGDGGPATSAELDNPTSVALDAAGNLYISDQFNMRIRMVDTSGVITTIAGTAAAGYSGDGGPATRANLNYPGGMVIDSSGDIFFSDDTNYRVREISPNGIINTVAGNGTPSYSGDGGPATRASLNGEFGLAIDPSGNLLIADSQNNRIREVTAASPVIPIFTSGSLTNSASFAIGCAPGALCTLFGQHLSVNFSGVASATVIPVPTSAAGTTLTINAVPAPLLAVVNIAGSEQINFQMPWEVAGDSTIQVVVDNGVSSNTAVSASLIQEQPGIFVIDANTDGAIIHVDGSVVTSSDPALPGETVVVFGTGFGPVDPPVPTGQAPSGLSSLTVQPSITMGGIDATVEFSGAAPYFVGLTQLNVTVPGNAPSGALDLVASSGGTTGNTVKIWVQ